MWLVDSWSVNRLESLKLVTDISSNHGAMITEIVWQRRLISYWFSWPKILRCRLTFRGLWIWIGDSSVPPPLFISRVKPLGWRSIIFSSWRGLALKSFFSVSLPFLPSWRKEMERMEVVRMIGVICQSLWWACHNTSVVITGLCYQGRYGGLLLQLGFFVWSLTCPVQFWSVGLESFFTNRYTR